MRESMATFGGLFVPMDSLFQILFGALTAVICPGGAGLSGYISHFCRFGIVTEGGFYVFFYAFTIVITPAEVTDSRCIA